MYYSIVETAIISIILIFTVHYLFDYLKNTLTVYKTNNVLHKHNEKYHKLQWKKFHLKRKKFASKK